MALGVIEILALIILAISAIKIIVILINPMTWMNSVVKPLWSKPMITGWICLILSGVVLYYLLQAGITIVQIFAVMLFMVLLIAFGMSIYFKELIINS